MDAPGITMGTENIDVANLGELVPATRGQKLFLK
jgi:hypothetical protein